MGSKTITTSLGEYLTFKNGKKSPDRENNGCFNVFGSNGKIGSSYVANFGKNTIVIGRVGTYCGSVHFSDEQCWVTDNAIACAVKGNESASFWFYLLGYLNLNQYRSGSGQPLLNQSILNSIQCSIPSCADNRAKVGHYLLSVEKKITLNRHINQTLEQMAQALFKSWFVDFDPVVDNALDAGFFEQDLAFPDELLRRAEARRTVREHGDFKPLPDATRQLFPAAFEECAEPSLGLGGWVPKGWNIRKLENLMELAYGKALKSTDRIDGHVPVYGSGGITGYHNEPLVDGPSIIVGRKGTVGSLYWEDRPFFPIDTVFYVRSEKPLTYCFSLLQTLGLTDMNTDAAVPGLNRNNAYRLQVITPNDDVLNAFDTFATTLRQRMFSNSEQVKTLTSLRDTLLPKLISGELRLDQIEADPSKEEVA